MEENIITLICSISVPTSDNLPTDAVAFLFVQHAWETKLSKGFSGMFEALC